MPAEMRRGWAVVGECFHLAKDILSPFTREGHNNDNSNNNHMTTEQQ